MIGTGGQKLGPYSPHRATCAPNRALTPQSKEPIATTLVVSQMVKQLRMAFSPRASLSPSPQSERTAQCQRRQRGVHLQGLRQRMAAIDIVLHCGRNHQPAKRPPRRLGPAARTKGAFSVLPLRRRSPNERSQSRFDFLSRWEKTKNNENFCTCRP